MKLPGMLTLPERSFIFQDNHNSTTCPILHAYATVGISAVIYFLIIYSGTLFVDKAGPGDLVQKKILHPYTRDRRRDEQKLRKNFKET